MKKMNKKGFTLVEIMIVVAIIGLLAAIGIPSILGAFANAQEKSKARNIADIEKAKGQITLPSESGVPGCISATGTNGEAYSGPELAAIATALKFGSIEELRTALTVDSTTPDIGAWGVKASY